MAADRVNQAEFARQMGVSKAAIGAWVRKGVITLDANGLLDPAAARSAVLGASSPAHSASRGTLAAKIAGSHAGASTAPPAPAADHAGAAPEAVGTSRYMVAKADREETEAARSKLKLLEEAGQLIRKEVAKAAFFGLARQTLEALRVVAEVSADHLAAETDPHACRVYLEKQLLDAASLLAKADPFSGHAAAVALGVAA